MNPSAVIDRRLGLVLSAVTLIVATGTALAPAGAPALLDTGVAHAGTNDDSI